MSQSSTITAGLDLGDKYSFLCLLDTENGEVIEEARLCTAPKALRRRSSGWGPIRIAIEAGTHSPWVSRLLKHLGHEALVANARKLRLIYAQGCKSDRIDAQNLARLARLDPKLLSPLKHRGEASQAHLAIVRSREALISKRGRSSSTTCGVRSSPSELVCPSAPRPPSTRKLVGMCPSP